MKTRRIGSLSVSEVGLGCNNFGKRIDEARSREVVHAALDAGITFFDTADVYGDTRSEAFLGRALGRRRNDVVVATKFGYRIDDQRQGAHPDYVRRAVEDSLRRLGTDRIDLYQLHKPDPKVPIADTLGALDDLVRAGKVREIGCSQFSLEQLREAQAVVCEGHARFVSVQNEYSLLHRDPERDVLPACEASGIAFIPFFPLASGLLTGKYHRGRPPPAGARLAEADQQSRIDDRRLAIVEALRAFATSRGHSLLELAIAALLVQPAVASVIAGATSPEQVTANARAASWALTQADTADLRALLDGFD